MADYSDYRDPNYKPPAKVYKALADKPRVVPGRGYADGDYDHTTHNIEYAVDYDTYDGSAGYKPNGKSDADMPPFWNYRPERIFIYHSPDDLDDSRTIKHGLEVLRMHGDASQKTGRPGLVMKRIVTYGPWEIIAKDERE